MAQKRFLFITFISFFFAIFAIACASAERSIEITKPTSTIARPTETATFVPIPTHTPAPTLTPTPLPIPPKGKIFFNKTVPYNEIFSVNTDGTDERRLTFNHDNFSNAEMLRISPDGQKIIFAYWEHGSRFAHDFIIHPWIIPVIGGEPERIYIPLQKISYPVWSPDGKAIAFAGTVDDNNWNACVVDTGGDNFRCFIFGSHWVSGVSWAPQGRQIAFVSESTPGKGDSLYVLDIDVTNIPRLVNNHTHYYVWSPDGKKIGFIEYSGQLYIAQRTEAKDFVPQSVTGAISSSDIKWSLDSEQFAYISSGNIYISNLPDGVQLRITDKGDASWLSWSPDGKQIAFLSEENAKSKIYLVKLAGGEPVLLTNNMKDNGCVRWSPNSDFIFYTSHDQSVGRDDIYVVKSDGSGTTLIAEHGLDCFSIWFDKTK